MCFYGRRAELFHCRYAVLEGFATASEVRTEMQNVLRWPASFLVEPSETMFDLVMSLFRGYEALKKEKDQDFWNPIVDQGVKIMDKEDSGKSTETHSSRKDLQLQ